MEIQYSSETPHKEQIFGLYEALNWNDFLKLDADQLFLAMKQSWYALYTYSDGKLIGTGRVISDGVVNAYICGLGVHPEYRHKGIGTEIMNKLVDQCRKNHLHIQFFCEEHLVPFYENMGFKKFAVGMKGE